MGSVQHVRQSTDSTCGEPRNLGEQVNVMYRQLKCLEQWAREITGDP